MTNPEQYLDIHDIAELTGLAQNSIKKYHQRATTNRANGTPKPNDLPAPDALTGTREQYAKPGWKPATIATWNNTRTRTT